MSKIFDIAMALLNCAEYNDEKLEAHGWPLPRSTEAELCRSLELGICKIILILNYSEKYFWSESNCRNMSKDLREELSKFLNNTTRPRTDEEQLTELSQGVENGISYLQRIKGLVKSKGFQHIEKYLCRLRQLAGERVSMDKRE